MPKAKPIASICIAVAAICALLVAAPGGRAVIRHLTPEFVKDAYHIVTGRFAGTSGTPEQWSALEASPWIEDGSSAAPRIVYVFTDLNCPYCERLWVDSRAWVDAGKVQLRYLVVGIVTPTSPGKAAALMTDPNPARLLRTYERRQAAAHGLIADSSDAQDRAAPEVKPLEPVPASIQSRLDANFALMKSMGLNGTPAVVWRNESNAVHLRAGAPEAALGEILGPL